MEKDILKKRFPKLSKAFHKDNIKRSDEISFKTKRTYNFVCDKGHLTLISPFYLTHNKLGKVIEDSNYECNQCKNINILENEKIRPLIDLKKNNLKKLKNLKNNSSEKIWIKACDIKSHTLLQSPLVINHAIKKSGKYHCPYCIGQIVDPLTNSLKIKLKDTVISFDTVNNKGINPSKIYYRSRKQEFNFKCNKGHKFKSTPFLIFYKKSEINCSFCAGFKVSDNNSLKSLYPLIFSEIHPIKNHNIDLEKIAPKSHKVLWWQCKNNKDHVWQQRVNGRTLRGYGCHLCKIQDNRKKFEWNKSTIIQFINSIENHINILTPAELFAIFQQTGNPSKDSYGRKFIKDFINGSLPKEEIDKFKEGENSTLDKYFEKFDENHKGLDASDEIIISSINDIDTNQTQINNSNKTDTIDEVLPTVSAKDTLETMEYCIRSSDKETLEFLLTSAKNKLWKNVFKHEEKNRKNKYVQEIFALKPQDEYSKKVHKEFIKEYSDAKSLTIPKGFSFKVDGKPELPNLMQLRTASRIKKDRFVGNWSGTGAGKTLSAILASRVINSKLTLICCPNSVVNNWETEIMEIYPDSFVQKKSFDTNNLRRSKKHKYLILNYEAFQQSSSDDDVLQLLANTEIDFVVIDEVHYTKQRNPDLMSKRKRLISSLITELRKKPNFAVLGMSATPVINNLEEGKGLIEMITGETHDDLDTKINEENCMKLHQKLVNNGLRMVFRPDTELKIQTIEVDCTDYVDEFKALQNQWFPLNVEQITTKAKIKTILEHIRPKTLIYTHYRQGIDQYLYEEIEKAGWKVGFFTGEDKSGLTEFKNGTLDVLIGTSTIGTGVNGLQNICSNLIVNSMPWTNAEFEQLIGRIYRQNQKQKKVDVIIPLTKAVVNGEDWSWCQSRYNRIKFKKTVGDAVIDGVLPTESIRTQAQVVQDIKKWLDRLSKGDETIIKRTKLKSQFIPGDKDNIKKRVGKFGDFSKMNTRWNKTHSEKLHERLQKDSTEFYHYHEMMEEKVKDWSVVPAKQIIKYYKNRPSRVIGDFGCGKAHLYNELSNKHQIYSFDHVAVNEHVTACDFSHTPLDPETLDSAVFSLSFMGSNITDYVKEAFRVMKVDGRIHIIEATSRFKNLDNFLNSLEKMGFEMVQAKPMSDRFTHIMAMKSDRSYSHGIKLEF